MDLSSCCRAPDDKRPVGAIDVWGKLNIIADTKAKAQLSRLIEVDSPIPTHAAKNHSFGPLHIDYDGLDIFVVNHLSRSLKQIIAERRAIHFWDCQGKQTFHPSTDLRILHHASLNVPLWRRLWIE